MVPAFIHVTDTLALCRRGKVIATLVYEDLTKALEEIVKSNQHILFEKHSRTKDQA